MKIKRTLIVLSCLLGSAFGPSTAEAGPMHMSFGVRVGSNLPSSATRVRVGRQTFHVYNGSFYEQVGDRYVLVIAPRGAVVEQLPRGATRLTAERGVYFEHAGVCYKQVRGGFQVCDRPAQLSPAAGTQTTEGAGLLAVQQNDQQYLFKDGIFFRRTADGLLVRTVPIGAMAKDFPPDAISVWYRDREYFESSGVFFAEVSGGFMVVPAPWQSVMTASSQP